MRNWKHGSIFLHEFEDHTSPAAKISGSDYHALIKHEQFSGGTASELVPTDPSFAQQWHLRDTVGVDTDINVTTVWNEFTGRSVLVGVYDDGAEYVHPDLNVNYEIGAEFVWQNVAQDPLPQSNEPWRNHGTAVAGLIVAENDGGGVVGVAFNAHFSAVPVFDDGGVFSADYLRAAMQHQTTFDVVNHSWGWSAYSSPVGSAQYNALADGAAWATAYGRDGLGTSMVAAAGNDRHGEQWEVPGDANAAGALVSSRYVVTVGGVGDDGYVAQYSNPGANLLVSAPTAADFSGAPDLLTTDRLGNDGYTSGNTTGFNGTSAATPLVTGVIALMYEANPDLGWRDVREILASSARHVGSAIGSPANVAQFEENPWLVNLARDWNGGGHAFSEDYGFGLVDAHAAVRLAETWSQQQTSFNEAHVGTGFTGAAVAIPDNNAAGRLFGFNMDSGVIVETAVLDLRFIGQHTYVGDLVIELTAPTGTSTTLLHRSGGEADVSQLTFSANAFLGEESGGFWTVRVSDQAGADIGTVASISLDVYGSIETADQTFIYTDEFGELASTNVWRRYLDGHDGQDTINASAVTSDVTIDLNGVIPNVIDGTSLNILGGIEHLIGGDGNDMLGGNSEQNSLRGMRGNDVLSGGDGNDVVDGGSDHDALYGGDGNDTLLGGAGDDGISAGVGDDWIDGGNGNDTVFGFDGNDFIVASRYGSDAINGGNGIDTLSFETQVIGVTIDIEVGAQTFQSFYPYRLTIGSVTFTGIENLTGTRQADNLLGDANANFLSGGDGDDRLSGRDGDDRLDGGFEGNDVLDGGAGNDLFEIYEEGTDSIFGGEGSDTISFASIHSGVTVNIAAQSYTFYFDGQPLGTTNWNGVENLIGTADSDWLSGDDSANRIEGADGNDTLVGQAGNDTVHGGFGNDSLAGGVGFDELHGGDGNDTIGGGDRGDQIFGELGNDLLSGGMGLDFIDGGAGNDFITGGLGNDTLTGGADADTFVFNIPATDGVDTITDFLSGLDTIQISAAGYGGQLIAGKSIDLVEVSSLTDSYLGLQGHMILQNLGGQQGILYWDADGGSSQNAIAIAILNGTGLESSDFHVV